MKHSRDAQDFPAARVLGDKAGRSVVDERTAEFRRIMDLPSSPGRVLAFGTWLRSIPDTELPLIAGLFRGLSRHRSIDGEYGLLLARWSARDPVRAFDFTATLLPRDSLLVNAANQGIAVWLDHDTNGLLSYLRTMRSDLTQWRSILVDETATQFAHRDFAGALDWAMQPDPLRHCALEAVVATASASQDTFVADHLALLSDRPSESADAIHQFIASFAVNAPGAALEWAATDVIDPALRESSMVSAIKYAAQRSPVSAAAWLQSEPIDVLLSVPGSTSVPDQFVNDMIFGFLWGAAGSSSPGFALSNLDLLPSPQLQDQVVQHYYSAQDYANASGIWTDSVPGGAPNEGVQRLARQVRSRFSAGFASAPSNVDADASADYTITTAQGQRPAFGGSLAGTNGGIYSVSSSAPVEFHLVDPRRAAASAIVSTLDRDAIPVQISGSSLTFTIAPGQTAIVDYGGGDTVDISVDAPAG